MGLICFSMYVRHHSMVKITDFLVNLMASFYGIIHETFSLHYCYVHITQSIEMHVLLYSQESEMVPINFRTEKIRFWQVFVA